ncbi:exopolyphosphatase / guanosine-5'-triphosphate,3'-diphosphate pyrophosphatase [Fodinibius roseus]|uniref:Exopolyphosphatase / guanosine-5'-triphosphate,3'-diphosphate pyrophosphatase n=1 Tax=Fodinibius roseus TaxID=1194090 RepID=A0A1M4ZEB7_9BACT|nr:Ppx/GppA phosphatase family protein [Fodinibius roseus]SHF16399.1 exopolyphosphatase / guanosine-5'-triphosphate,3'-diphosphate pyrophosphatase [Fodinibius roseus]
MAHFSNNSEPSKRIAAIDLGTNSFHAIIMDIYPDGSYRRMDKLKEMVLLAEGGMRNMLSKEAMNRGIKALEKIKFLCDNLEVEEILAYATSAIREAENGGAFIQRSIDEVGIKPLAISGSREANLIGQAIQHAVTLDEQPVLMVDIGGGSVEFIIGNKEELFFNASYKIGAARMATSVQQHDPATKKDIRKLEKIFKDELKEVRKLLNQHSVDTIVGSSGTMENIAEMIAERKSLSTSLSLNELVFSAQDFNEFYDDFITFDHAKRSKLDGLDKKRIDIIIPGVVLLRYLMKSFGIEKVRISEDALREGMILDHIHQEKHNIDIELKSYFPNPRRRSVFELLIKCDWHEDHSRHVTSIALKIFDVLRNELDFNDNDRELLEYASLMHDIGYYISHRKHHKHALYLIRYADLRGFKEEEIEVMANVARYHRRSTPKKRHKRYRKLDKPLRKKVKKLSGILRIADGMDRSHYQNVKHVDIEIGEEEINIALTTESDPQLEIWGAMRKSTLFEEVTGRTLIITAKSREAVS